MKDNYFLGGYYLVEGSPPQSWMNRSLLPTKLYSISTHISEHHPYLSLLTWVDEPPENYRLKLGLDLNQFAALQIKADRWFDREQYGWAGVWIDPDIAREFALDYLSHIENLKLIAIALESSYRNEFLIDYNPKLGVDRILRSGQTIELNRGFLGYEILGDDRGSFCSFICNHLETDLKQKLGIRLNRYGLIEQYDLAIQATDYINLPETGAEPLLWQPWAIIELEI